MDLSLNIVQRVILICAGLVLLIAAFGSMDSMFSDGWLATALFVLSVGAFVLAASSRNKTDD